MPKALFFNVPAHGHINPSLPLVTELVRRGHDIRYYATESYRQRVTATGAAWFTYDARVEDDYFDGRGLDGTDPQKAAVNLLGTTRAILPDLLQITREAQPDYIIYDCMCPWGYFIGQIMKLPTVSSFSLLPLSPRLFLNWQVLRLLLPMLITGFRSGTEANRLASELGKQYGVKSLDRMTVLSAPGDLSISYSSSAFVPFADTLADSFRLVGWTLPETTADEPFVRDSERKLIYISLGTVANENIGFFKRSIEALAGTGYDVLISTGGRFEADQFGTLPDNISLKPWVPQPQVLQQAALFITHGGINSLHDALYYGVPLLVVPQQTEQTFNGIRVVDLAVGLMLRPQQVTVAAIRSSTEQLLSDNRYQTEAKRIGDSLRAAGGVARAVDEIEALLKRREVERHV